MLLERLLAIKQQEAEVYEPVGWSKLGPCDYVVGVGQKQTVISPSCLTLTGIWRGRSTV